MYFTTSKEDRMFEKQMQGVPFFDEYNPYEKYVDEKGYPKNKHSSKFNEMEDEES